MQTLLAVIDDLWQFAYGGLFGARSVTPIDREREFQPSLGLLPSPQRQGALPAPASSSVFRTGEQYFIAELQTFLYSDPVIAFDTAMQTIPYGHTVLVTKVGGRWAEVIYEGREGWVLKDVLRERREDIHPQLRIDTIYTADDAETIKLRACINDEFGGARAGLALTPAEYVTYKLAVAKRSISWPKDGPRVPGSWQKRLRGSEGIHMSIAPSTGDIMEYSVEDVGYLAYVEAVFPDNSIKLSQVGVPDAGQYTERVMTQEEYRELRPVFITVG